ncbi:TPA: NADPH:quinone reductase [Candidatus Saccharibacteria bacterium]|nr:NADPH:quinone reductase [Candidatus Saccharibacteria bacterium]HRK40464.1 NADP-dependent oxidoreductase [Candidatus Saccharibacteria bacterium]
MKAAQIATYGDSSVIKVVDINRPTVSEGTVLVEVHASSLNPFDTTVREGHVKAMMPPLPVTLGGDIAGIVLEVGAGVTTISPGDNVYGQAAAIAGNSGAFAEYAVTKASQIATMPTNLDFKAAASLPLVGVSAWQALNEHINLQPGQKIFIHGGAGGIGTVAIQIAKSIGAYVITTATGDGLQLVEQLGADELIDYKQQDFTDALHDLDAVFDTVGGDDFSKSLAVLRQGGIAVSMIAQPDTDTATELGVTALMQQTTVTTEKLAALRDLVEGGRVTPQIGRVFALDDIQAAFTSREAGSINGKVVIEIAS